MKDDPVSPFADPSRSATDRRLQDDDDGGGFVDEGITTLGEFGPVVRAIAAKT